MPAPAARSWRPARWLAAAALVLLSAAWLWLSRVPGTGPTAPGSEPAFRDGSPVEITTPLPDGLALPRDRFVLKWTGLPEGSLATVELADEDLHLLHRAEEQSSDSVRIPAQDLAGVPAGTPLLWRVEAILPDGRLVSSQAFRVRIDD
jgi:hypothetical protein